MTISVNRESKRWLYFDKFKMLLHHNKVHNEINLSKNAPPYCVEKRNARRVIIA